MASTGSRTVTAGSELHRPQSTRARLLVGTKPATPRGAGGSGPRHVRSAAVAPGPPHPPAAVRREQVTVWSRCASHPRPRMALSGHFPLGSGDEQHEVVLSTSHNCRVVVPGHAGDALVSAQAEAIQAGARRAPGRAGGCQQVVRRPARAPGHQPLRQARRGRGGDRPVGLGQVDAVPRDQPPRDHRPGLDHPRRPAAAAGGQGAGGPARRGRHGLPVASTSSPTRRSWRTSPSARSRCASSRRPRPRSGPRAARPRRRRPPGRQVPRPALRRPAAARRHRPGPGDGAQGDALRRAHLGARPGDDQGGPRRHGRPRRARHDHGRGHPRDGLRPHRGRPGGLHGRRRRSSRRTPPRSSSPTRRASAPRTSSARSSSTDPPAPTTTATNSTSTTGTGHPGGDKETAMRTTKIKAVAGRRRCSSPPAPRRLRRRRQRRRGRRRRRPRRSRTGKFEEGSRMAELADAGKITVGVKYDQPGLGFKDAASDIPTGFDVEIAKLLVADLGIDPATQRRDLRGDHLRQPRALPRGGPRRPGAGVVLHHRRPSRGRRARPAPTSSPASRSWSPPTATSTASTTSRARRSAR